MSSSFFPHLSTLSQGAGLNRAKMNNPQANDGLRAVNREALSEMSMPVAYNTKKSFDYP
jgi:hypothetical protein